MAQTKILRESFKIVRSTQKRYSKNMKENYDKKHKTITFKVGDKVLLDRPKLKTGYVSKLDVKFEGPYIIIRKHSKLNYTIRDPISRRQIKVHVQRIVPFYEDIYVD